MSLVMGCGSWGIDKANMNFVKTLRKYENKGILYTLFGFGVGIRSTSKAKQNSLPIATIILAILVLSIGARFQAYWLILQFWRMAVLMSR